MASASDLKLVRIVQRIGKKISSATPQARMVKPQRLVLEILRAMVLLQGLADHPHQEDRDDIGKDDGDDAPGGCAADVELQKRLAIDQIGQVGGLVAGAAIGRDQDLGKD